MSVACSLEFLETFRTRREHFQALLTLSRRQKQLIAESDYSELLAVLGQKQRLLGRLEELNRHQPDLRRRWQDQRESLDGVLRDDCEHLLAETEALLAALLDEEQTSTSELSARRDETQRQLQAISQGSQIHDAYRDQLAPATHRHLDTGR